MDRVTSRVKGGLVHLESTRDEPDLTSVRIFAENSIVSTTAGDDPLFRVEGQDQLDPRSATRSAGMRAKSPTIGSRPIVGMRYFRPGFSPGPTTGRTGAGHSSLQG